MSNSGKKGTSRGYRFGTFKGVFTPSILTILGVIMYLRIGWVLGNVGLARTLLIVTLACAITFLTGLSLAALATNMRVGGGGAYFIISRSLGIEPGAAVGLPLYLAQALSIAFYISGFAEAMVSAYPGWSPLTVKLATLSALALVAYISASLALRLQYVVMTLIVLSLVSFFAGGAPDTAALDAGRAVSSRLPFWAVFAVFFPAVTGIEAGIAMSGDLENPSRSLPLGTIAAVVTGFVIYLAIPIYLAAIIRDRSVLLAEPLVMARAARWGELVLYGVWAASLSSAMGALLGAPRTLQALARDRVLPRFISRGYGRGRDPRAATAFSFFIALAGILVGGINVIAPVLSMFFLTSYGLLNLSAGLEELISSPSWRPTFKVPAAVSLTGFFACFAAMLMINAGATLVAGAVSAAVYYYMKKRSLRARWGDVRYGALMFGAREMISRLAGRKRNEKMWKPNILALSGSPYGRWYLIELAEAISQGRSFLTVATIIPESAWTAERAERITGTIREHLKKHAVQAFIKTIAADEPLVGAQQLIRFYGFGPIVPNTVIIGETEKAWNYLEFARLVQLVYRRQRNLVVVREGKKDEAPEGWDGVEKRSLPRGDSVKHRIDVWWKGKANNFAFMLALAVLLKRSTAWRAADLVIKMIVQDPAGREEAEKGVAAFVEKERLGVQTEVLVSDGRDVFETVRASSGDASLVFLGLRYPEEGESAEEYSLYYERMLARTDGLPPTALLMAAEQIDFKRIFDSAAEIG